MLQKGDIIICICQVVMFTMLHSSSLGMRIKCGAHLPRQRRTAKLGSNPKKPTKAAQWSENPFGYSIKNPRLCSLHSALHFYHGILSKTLQNLQDLPNTTLNCRKIYWSIIMSSVTIAVLGITSFRTQII